jgi:hypothetical protein
VQVEKAREREEIHVGRGANLHIHSFGEGVVFYMEFLANNGVSIVES